MVEKAVKGMVDPRVVGNVVRTKPGRLQPAEHEIFIQSIHASSQRIIQKKGELVEVFSSPGIFSNQSEQKRECLYVDAPPGVNPAAGAIPLPRFHPCAEH